MGAYGQAALDSILASLTYTLLLSMWAGHLFWVKKLKPANSALPLKKKSRVCICGTSVWGCVCHSRGVEVRQQSSLSTCFLIAYRCSWQTSWTACLQGISCPCLPSCSRSTEDTGMCDHVQLPVTSTLRPSCLQVKPFKAPRVISLVQPCHFDPAQLWVLKLSI